MGGFRKAQHISQGLCTGATVKGHVYLDHTWHSGMPRSVWGPCTCSELLDGKSYTAVWKVVVAHPFPNSYPYYSSQESPWPPVSDVLGQLPLCHKSPGGPFSRPWANGFVVDTVTNTANHDLSLFLSRELAAEKCQGTRTSRGGGLLLSP